MSNLARAGITTAKPSQQDYQHISNYFDEKYELMWCYMHASPRACFSKLQLKELLQSFTQVRRHNMKGDLPAIKYHVLASDVDGIYNLGGDLNLFRDLIVRKDRGNLLKYATSCIEALYTKMTNFGSDVTHITLVQGDALGGGMECAISSDVLIAEKGSVLGMPEIIFNLFPGMGAYSILSRKIGAAQAEKMILSGRLYTAEELHELGVVDVLAEKYQGELAVYDYIKSEQRSSNGIRALRAAKKLCNPITREELMNITTLWVDAALRLEKRDLRMMERLVSRQNHK